VLVNNQDINRILYYTDNVSTYNRKHNSTTVIHSNDLENHLVSLNKKFDLICIDTWHEYELSSRDFRIISSALNESGILISHDCYPWNKRVANPLYINESWCGETYISFVEFAYNNPNMFYTVLNIDTGIGILSKKELSFLSNKLDKNKQEYLLQLHKNSNNPYAYFVKHSKDIINSVSS
jgi:predicted O-methyltransferase YrrM